MTTIKMDETKWTWKKGTFLLALLTGLGYN